MIVKCVICEKLVKERRNFSNTNNKYPSRHMRTKTELCHGFFEIGVKVK